MSFSARKPCFLSVACTHVVNKSLTIRLICPAHDFTSVAGLFSSSLPCLAASVPLPICVALCLLLCFMPCAACLFGCAAIKPSLLISSVMLVMLVSWARSKFDVRQDTPPKVDLETLRGKTWSPEGCKELFALCHGIRKDEHSVRVMASTLV